MSLQNGTCYTDTECDELQGIPGGSCAEGYGVCCVCKLSLLDNAPNYLVGCSIQKRYNFV